MICSTGRLRNHVLWRRTSEIALLTLHHIGIESQYKHTTGCSITTIQKTSNWKNYRRSTKWFLESSKTSSFDMNGLHLTMVKKLNDRALSFLSNFKTACCECNARLWTALRNLFIRVDGRFFSRRFS